MIVPFEQLNVDAYRLLLRLEVAVRESLRHEMALRFEHWQRQLPSELKAKIRDQQKDELSRKQHNYLRLGPLYYLTYGELVDLCSRNPWRDAAIAAMGSGIVDVLRAVSSPRNAVAHSRSVSPSGLTTAAAAYDQVAVALSPERLDVYLANPESGLFPEDARDRLAVWLVEARGLVAALADQCDVADVLHLARAQFWWPDAELSGFDTKAIDDVAVLVREYNSLPRGVGSASGRQRWLDSSTVLSAFDRAIRSTGRAR